MKLKKFCEVLDNVNFDLSLVNSDIVRLLRLASRLCNLGFRFATKEPNKRSPDSFDLFANGNNFISSSLDLNKRFLSLLVKITPSLDVFNKASRKEADADRINL